MIGLDVSAFLVWGILAALVALAGLLLHVRRRRRVARALGDRALVERIAGEDLFAVPWARVLAVGLTAVALSLALADPRWGDGEGPPVQGGTVVLVLDASTSMLAADLPPSRLEQERQAARTIARALPGSPIGIIAFAGRAYAVAAPTRDPGSIELYLDALHPDMVTQTGSSIAAAVRQGVAMLIAADSLQGGALVIVSDGDTDEDPAALRDAADLARRAGIPVYALGAGTDAGATVPALHPEPGDLPDVLRGPDGEPIVTRLREARLRDLAQRTGGAYLPLVEADASDRIASAVRGRATSASGGDEGAATAAARYTWFALIALVLLLWEAAPRRRGVEP